MKEHLEREKQKSQPQLVASNPWKSNDQLRIMLQNVILKRQFKVVDKQFQDFGEICNNVLYPLALESERNQPKLIQFDVYGNRIDQLITSQGWQDQKQFAAKLHIVGSAYEQGEYSRLLQLVRLVMYQPVSGLYGCPLAMTDGAAYLLQNWLRAPTTKDAETNQFVQEAYKRLTSNDPSLFWTSGQWMTEKDGGSDVSRATMTLAIPLENNKYRLYGYKWFSSATDSDISITLARIVDESKLKTLTPAEIQKLPISLFILRVKDGQGKLNGIEIQTLKDKLGTRQLPTAELVLNGTTAYLISEQGKGIKGISHMLNVTRIYNAASAVGSLNRIYQIVLDYSSKRQAFGQKLDQLPTHQSFLLKFNIIVRAVNVFYFRMAFYFNKVQSETATQDDKEILRLMTPLLKLYTAKKGVQWISEGLEALGALGYMENSNIPQIFRDSQVLTIWEGTTNILCLDFLKALKSNSKDEFEKLDVYCRHNTHSMMTFLSSDSLIHEKRQSLIQSIAKMSNNHNGLIAELSGILKGSIPIQEGQTRIRDLCFMLTENYIASLLLDEISSNGKLEDIVAYELWVEQMNTYSKQQYSGVKSYEVLIQLNKLKQSSL